MKSRIGFGLLLFGVTVGLAAAEPTAENLIKYRQSVMSAIGSHMGASVSIIRGRVGYQHLQQHTGAVASMLTIASDVFPPASATGETRALPAIWEKPDAFAAALKSAQDAAASLETAAAGSDSAATDAALKKLVGTCTRCHDDFRKPEG